MDFYFLFFTYLFVFCLFVCLFVCKNQTEATTTTVVHHGAQLLGIPYARFTYFSEIPYLYIYFGSFLVSSSLSLGSKRLESTLTLFNK